VGASTCRGHGLTALRGGAAGGVDLRPRFRVRISAIRCASGTSNFA
jgi:hypothetical protein